MQAIEFAAKIHDGVVRIPKQFSHWTNKSVRVIILEEAIPSYHREPHPTIAGKGKTIGDLLTPIVDDSDWECLK